MSRSVLMSRLSGVVLAMGMGCAGSALASYNAMYVFGDSLSDSGNDLNITTNVTPPLAPAYVPAPAYYTDGSATGRFTNGYNYADLLAQSLGLNLKASTLGGTNYAYGGARSDYVRPELAAYGALSFNDQISQYLGTYGAADPNALYVLWIGSNDMSDALLQAVNTYMSGGDPVPVISAEIGQTVNDIITALVTLESLGGKHFLVGNIPDMALTPTVQSFGSAGISFLANQASVGFNNALLGALPMFTFPGVDLNIIDSFGLQTAVANNPAAYGVTNTTSACYDGQIDGSASPGTTSPTVCATPGQYEYFDGEHPGVVMHQLQAAGLKRLLVPEPGEMALSLAALGLMGFSRMRRPRR